MDWRNNLFVRVKVNQFQHDTTVRIIIITDLLKIYTYTEEYVY